LAAVVGGHETLIVLELILVTEAASAQLKQAETYGEEEPSAKINGKRLILNGS
jgi:hypothetical protein